MLQVPRGRPLGLGLLLALDSGQISDFRIIRHVSNLAGKRTFRLVFNFLILALFFNTEDAPQRLQESPLKKGAGSTWGRGSEESYKVGDLLVLVKKNRTAFSPPLGLGGFDPPPPEPLFYFII